MQKTLFLISLTFLFSILKQAYSDPHSFNRSDSEDSLEYINRDMRESFDEKKDDPKEKKRKEKEQTIAQKELHQKRSEEQWSKAPKKSKTDDGHFLTSPS